MILNNFLSLVNSEAGRYLLGAKEDEFITELVPNGYHVYQGSHNKKDWYIARFFTWDRVDSVLGSILTKMDIAKTEGYEPFLHFSGLHVKNYKYPQIFLDTFTANGGGQGRVTNSGAVYATVHDAATGQSADNSTARPNNASIAGTFYIARGFAPFNSASLPNDATIVSGSNTFVRAVGTGTTTDADSDSVSLVASTQASNTALVVEDYDQAGTTKFATDITFAAWNASGNNDFQLNANGISNISLTSYSKFAWRTAKDIASTTPTGDTQAFMVDNTNLLSVEYTVPAMGIYTII